MAISRDDLVRRLAEVSHLTYVRQKSRDQGVPLAELTLEVTDHDLERAEDIVAELERLGVYGDSGTRREPERAAPAEPEPAAPAEPEPAPPEPDGSAQPEGWKAQPVTDLWGNPITKRRRRR
jgi:hypothetical protein